MSLRRRIFLALAFASLLATNAPAQSVLLSELADPRLNYQTDRFVEISDEGQDGGGPETTASQRPPMRPADPPLNPPEAEVEPETDPTDTIVRSIQAALAPPSDEKTPVRPLSAPRSFFRRLFRFPRSD